MSKQVDSGKCGSTFFLESLSDIVGKQVIIYGQRIVT